MNLSVHVLQYLLFMSPDIGLAYGLTTPHCVVLDSGGDLRSFNRVRHCALPTAPEIEQIKSHFGDRPFSWGVEHTDIQTMQLLLAHNLSERSTYPVMGIQLGSFEQQPDKAALVVKIVNLSNCDERIDYANLKAAAFGTQAAQCSAMIDFFRAYSTPGSMTLYVGYYQEKAVAVGMTLQHNRTATVHWIGTLPEYRNKGVGYAVTYAALVTMQKAGCTQAFLLATPMGRPLYERMGFTEYTRYSMYSNYSAKK